MSKNEKGERNPGRGADPAYEECDYCGFDYHKRDLRMDDKGFRVCEFCLDEAVPQK